MAVGCVTDNYFAASFKGASFEAMDISSEYGTRNAVGEFVFSQATGLVPLGRRVRTFTLTGRLVQNTHLTDVKAVIAACESSGAGLLVHPTLGVIRVACTSLKVKNNTLTDQGWTQLDFSFTEATSLGVGFSLSINLFGIDITALLSAVQTNFLISYTPSKARLHDVPTVTATVASSLSQLSSEYAKTLTIPQTNGAGATDEQWQTLSDQEDIINNASLHRVAATAHTSLTDFFTTLSETLSGQDKYDAMKRVVNAHAKSSGLYGTGGTSQDSVYATVRLMGVARMVQAALETKVSTLDAALLQYDQVVSVVEGEAQIALSACDDSLFLALRVFLDDAKTRLLDRAYKLPALIVYNLNHSVHSLVAAYEIFGDAKRFTEIESRNRNAKAYQVGPEIIGAAS